MQYSPHILALALILACAGSVFAQTALNLIVQWDERSSIITKALPPFSSRPLSPALRIDLLSFTNLNQRNAAHKLLAANHNVRYVQPDAPVHSRSIPNDEHYTRQVDNLERTGFTDAWRISTGGVSPGGVDIVIAVLDAGFEIGHEDIAPNVWRNAEERPGDGVDNDGNGYIDDVSGWNMIDGNNRHPVLTHGTQVLGTLAAKGDNEKGIVGTNWDVKILPLASSTVAQVIEAYEYVRYQRELYNTTDGERGAFVVATNASFGIEGATCAQFPVWGEMYNELGRVGVLTAASTANRSWDVDTNGDMPTDCTSDYIIGVANMGLGGTLFPSSAYGRVNIDLAAPGEGSYSTLPGSLYGPFGSTSAAAPYVAGAIALLYATDCPFFQDLVVSDPSEAALVIRELILNGVARERGIQFRVATGGLLNVAESQRMLLSTCSAITDDPLTIRNVFPNPASTHVILETNKAFFGEGARIRLFDVLGRQIGSALPFTAQGIPLDVEIRLPRVSPGYYTILFEQGGQTEAVKFVVK